MRGNICGIEKFSNLEAQEDWDTKGNSDMSGVY